MVVSLRTEKNVLNGNVLSARPKKRKEKKQNFEFKIENIQKFWKQKLFVIQYSG